MNRAKIWQEARKKWLAYQKNPPATGEMLDLYDFCIEEAYNAGEKYGRDFLKRLTPFDLADR